ncbi:glycosyltransferase family 2 protein [Flavobacterium gilvum]|uniref:Glycosyltransferase 2-like domain-containing protein n=1 Tax=Flavobacterium gilvum TaxID=1492737 RepID=A0AAC9N346_9FLAO|nr:glycosyltransferase [Flavobacterium gilvum]AOW08125.1 hypothetical protein EM308_00610 [Flavobacterium gilvum]KFC58908.1 hypothetical protein FEM08_23100 [Flavobacterium gilvum]
MMISVVIRNKNEADYLERTLSILTKRYSDDIDEIIIVDNNSTDNSIKVAKKYNCKVVNIEQFTYGKAINLGIRESKNNYVFLLSSHSIPIGGSFFKNSIQFIKDKKDFAGLRFINSIENYERAIINNFEVKDPLKFGFMAACGLLSKEVWEQIHFDEKLVFKEDKEWSEKVTQAGYKIYDIDETFFYFINRSEESELNRFKNETISEFQLYNRTYHSKIKIVASLIKKIFFTNLLVFFKTIKRDFKMAKIKFEINNFLNKKT